MADSSRALPAIQALKRAIVGRYIKEALWLVTLWLLLSDD